MLKIATARGAVLLTGDIEARSEQELLARAPGELRAEGLAIGTHSVLGALRGIAAIGWTF